MVRACLVLGCVLSSAPLAAPARQADATEPEHGSSLELAALTPAQVESLARAR